MRNASIAIAMLRATIAALIFVGASGPAFARANGYTCKVLASGFLSDAGTLEFHAQDLRVGQTFAVDRRSGSIIGNEFTSEFWTTKVLDEGSDQQSFKMVATTDGFMHVMYLNVKEYVRGPIKPFVLTDDSMVTTGTCE